MARGPKPKPAAVQRMRESSRRPIVEDAVLPGVKLGRVAPPAWLEGAALAVWSEKAPLLAAAKLLTEVDALAFARYCRNLARWLKMQGVLDSQGETYTIKSASGEVHRPRPEFLIADRVERQLLAAEDRFGLNPAERQRIFAARAASGATGDLFQSEPAPRRPGDPAAPASEPARPIEGPIGLLN